MKTPEELNDIQKQTEGTARRSALAPITYAEVEKAFKKWMIVPDPGLIRFLLAIYLSNRLPGKAVWIFVIGPSGGGKTEFLHPFTKLPESDTLSSLTSNTFLSGMPGKGDASLLPKLTGKVVIMKDWTTILSLQKDERGEIYSQFREIWDGEYKKTFGTGLTRTWEGKITIMAATTQAVDLAQQQNTHLGERFISYRPMMPERKIVAKRALENNRDQEQMQSELEDAVFAFVKGVDERWDKKFPPFPVEYHDEIVNLANFCTMARSGIIRDTGMKKDVVFVPAAEMPTRIAGQLAKLGAGLSMINDGVFDKEDTKIIYKCALDSIPQTNKMVIIEMAKADKQTTAEIATALGYPTEPIRMYLENLAMLRVCARIKQSGVPDRWTMVPEFSDIIRVYEGVAELTEDERHDRETAASLATNDITDRSNEREFDEYPTTPTI